VRAVGDCLGKAASAVTGVDSAAGAGTALPAAATCTALLMLSAAPTTEEEYQ